MPAPIKWKIWPPDNRQQKIKITRGSVKMSQCLFEKCENPSCGSLGKMQVKWVFLLLFWDISVLIPSQVNMPPHFHSNTKLSRHRCLKINVRTISDKISGQINFCWKINRKKKFPLFSIWTWLIGEFANIILSVLIFNLRCKNPNKATYFLVNIWGKPCFVILYRSLPTFGSLWREWWISGEISIITEVPVGLNIGRPEAENLS